MPHRYNPITREDLTGSILNPLYGGAMETLDAHQLSVFFIVLASGVLFDSNPLLSALAERYHLLARAAFSQEPISKFATCVSVQALFSIILYSYFHDRSANEERWLLVGLCARIAQRVGFQLFLLDDTECP